MTGEGLTDAERSWGTDITPQGRGTLVFSESAVARIKADAIVTARAEERARLGAAVESVLDAMDVGLLPCLDSCRCPRSNLRKVFPRPFDTKAVDQ